MLIQVFICYKPQHFLVSSWNSPTEVLNKKNILRFISTYSCLTSQPISTLTPTHKSHMSTSTQVLADVYLWDLAILRYIFSEQSQGNLQCPALEAANNRSWKSAPSPGGRKGSSPSLGYFSIQGEHSYEAPKRERTKTLTDRDCYPHFTRALKYRRLMSLPQ